MSAQALSQVTFRRTRLLYIPTKKTMIRTSAIKIIQPIISQPHAGRSLRTVPVSPIYVSMSATVKKGGLLCVLGALRLICYLWRIFLHWFMLRLTFLALSLYALQDTLRFRV